MKSRRQQGERLGRRAEWFVALWLRLTGYSILAQRFRTPVGEIDLIARRGGLLLFVEVKARRGPVPLDELVPARAQKRLRRAADAFLARNPRLVHADQRFDLFVVAPTACFRRYRNFLA